MKLNYFTKSLSIAARWMATLLVCLLAIAFTSQSVFVSTASAMAAPEATLIASADAGDRVQQKAGEDARRAKNFIRDTADKVERTANKNADRVENATDGNNSLVERKANRDAARIERRAEQDTARTQKAVDDTKNVVERTVDNIKDAFGN
jgi:hypothetical protein